MRDGRPDAGKFMRTLKNITMILLCLLCAATMPARSAQAMALLEKIFPAFFSAKHENSRPERTLRAPFAETQSPAEAGKDGKDSLSQLYNPKTTGTSGGPADLSVARKDKKSVGEWVQHALSEVLAVDAATYEKHLKYLATGMDDYALDDYKKFMQDTKILQTLRDGQYKLQCIVESDPVLLNDGPAEGRYRWLYDVPVTITFLPKEMRSYQDQGQNPVSQRIIVRLQVGQVAQGGAEGVMIESWTARASSGK